MPRTIKAQPIMSTLEDRQGERKPLSVLQAMLEGPLRRPLNQQHDNTKKSIGYMENLRILEIEDTDDDWQLVADITITDDSIDLSSMGGFSISYTTVEDIPDGAHLIVLLPFPHYNDDVLKKELFDLQFGIGKHTKKAADPATIALACSLFVLTPVWKKAYDEKVEPALRDFFSKAYDSLKKKNIGLDLSLRVQDGRGNTVRIILVPDRNCEVDAFSSGKVREALGKAEEFVATDGDTLKYGLDYLRMCYYPASGEYKIINATYKNGTDTNFVA